MTSHWGAKPETRGSVGPRFRLVEGENSAEHWLRVGRVSAKSPTSRKEREKWGTGCPHPDFRNRRHLTLYGRRKHERLTHQAALEPDECFTRPVSQRFPFALWFSYHFFSASSKPIHPSHLPPANYSFKVVFRVFRDFHSVPVKPLICSNWNIGAKTASPLPGCTSERPFGPPSR
jgi:hypothetical protein